MSARIAIGLAAVLAVAGCGYRDPPAPVVTPAAPASEPAAMAAAPAESRFHVVRRGDTLSELAQRYGVGMSSLAQANGLRPPYRIKVGQQLRLPGGAPVPAVAARPPERAVERMPEPVASMAAPRPPVPVAAAPLAPPSPAAVRPSPPAAAVAAAPEPAAARPSALPPPASGERATVVATLPPLQEASPAPAAAAARAAPEPPPPAAVQPAPSAGGGRFLWPLEGKVVVGYGPQPGGLHNDGINIAADRGTPVRAADDGMVAYAGNELGGFGNLLLIKHADGWLTAYAHNEEILVKIGDTVRRGQMVARVGSSGSANAPQLHFEIRRGERPVDPMPLLDGSATVRSTVAPAGRRDPG